MTFGPRIRKKSREPFEAVALQRQNLSLLLEEQTTLLRDVRSLVRDVTALAASLKDAVQVHRDTASTARPTNKSLDCPFFGIEQVPRYKM